MNPWRLLLPVNRWLEPLLGLAVFAGLVRALLFLYTDGYLPQPFFYDPNDTFMDWFNITVWAHDVGRYDNFSSIYPPLSFVLLNILARPACYLGNQAVEPRDCDWVGMAALHGFFALNIVLIAVTFLKIDRRTALPRAFALGAGLPMCFGLNRGNLIIVTFTCVLIAYGPLIRSARLKWLAAGLAVNFKIYMIAAIFAQLLRRRWRWFEGAMFATIAVYVVTYAILGNGSPIEIFNNISEFAGFFQSADFLDLWYTTTYTALNSLLFSPDFPVVTFVGSLTVERLAFVLPMLLHIVQGSILLAAGAAWIRPETVPMHRLTFFGIAMALITSEAGGYTQVLLIFFVFMEPWRGFGRKWATIACYVLCLPGDIIITRLSSGTLNSYLAGRPIVIEYAITWGPFFRPAIILSLPFALACVTLREVWLDIRTQGWKMRWRYRHDLPIMIGQGRPSPPVAG